MKIAVFDLETWDLTPTFGPILCGSVLTLPDGEMVTFRQDDYLRDGYATSMIDDAQLCVDLREHLEEHHMTIGYFSKGFDLSHLRSRLAKHGERPLKQMLHFDPIWHFKGWRGIKGQSSKMKHMAEFFDLGEKKPDVPPEVWLLAREGNLDAMNEVVERCEADVRITLELATKAMELDLVKNIGTY